MRETLKKLHKDNSGASLLFVLGIMMFLLVIGTSVLIAASTNVGYMTNQMERNRIILLEESVHNTIMFSLQNNDDPNSLGQQLALALFRASENCGECAISFNIWHRCLVDIPNVGIVFNDGVGGTFNFINENVTINNIRIEFPIQIVDRVAFFAWAEFDWPDDDAPVATWFREPRVAFIDARINVIVDIRVRNRFGNDRFIRSRAVYEYMDGVMSDHPLCPAGCDGAAHQPDACFDGFTEAQANQNYPMFFTNFGTWRLVSYENIN